MLATVASVNSANRLKARLSNKYSVPSRVIQTPSVLTKEGCGYSLRFDDRHKAAVKNCAAELRINIRAFFREDLTGTEVNYMKE